MIKFLEPVIIGYPYPTGLGYRCFDGERWHDCDWRGRLLRKKR